MISDESLEFHIRIRNAAQNHGTYEMLGSVGGFGSDSSFDIASGMFRGVALSRGMFGSQRCQHAHTSCDGGSEIWRVYWSPALSKMVQAPIVRRIGEHHGTL